MRRIDRLTACQLLEFADLCDLMEFNKGSRSTEEKPKPMREGNDDMCGESGRGVGRSEVFDHGDEFEEAAYEMDSA